jgi:uncharacterized protein YndB with AHSA1/START domain
MAGIERLPDVRATIDVAHPPLDVWTAIADPARAATWSPETALVIVPHPGPLTLGERFSGTNRRGRRSWSTSCRVVECIPGESFAFDVTFGPLRVSRWRYLVEPVDAGTRVEEQWWDMRGGTMTLLSRVGTGVSDRREHNRRSMTATLVALKAEMEAVSLP